jgi:hypothetical protein
MFRAAAYPRTMASRSAKPEYPSWLAEDERKAVRIPVNWPATVTADKFDTQAVRISDCTKLGCRIETPLAVTVGTFVHVAIPNFADVPGWVAWSSPEAIGVDFGHPLPDRVLEYIIDLNDAI